MEVNSWGDILYLAEVGIQELCVVWLNCWVANVMGYEKRLLQRLVILPREMNDSPRLLSITTALFPWHFWQVRDAMSQKRYTIDFHSTVTIFSWMWQFCQRGVLDTLQRVWWHNPTNSDMRRTRGCRHCINPFKNMRDRTGRMHWDRERNMLPLVKYRLQWRCSTCGICFESRAHWGIL